MKSQPINLRKHFYEVLGLFIQLKDFALCRRFKNSSIDLIFKIIQCY